MCTGYPVYRSKRHHLARWGGSCPRSFHALQGGGSTSQEKTDTQSHSEGDTELETREAPEGEAAYKDGKPGAVMDDCFPGPFKESQ